MSWDPLFILAASISLKLLLISIWLFPFPNDNPFNWFRRKTLPLAERVGADVDWLYVESNVTDRRLAAVLSLEPSKVEDKLTDIGFIPNIASSIKRNGHGNLEVGSFAYRESDKWYIPNILALKQLHVIVFRHPEGSQVYAHQEYNSLRPDVALKHYRGEKLESGTQKFREIWLGHYGSEYIER